MERFLMSSLVAWKNSPRRKPLVLGGARQVGKTWLMKEFGKHHFRNVAYISFDNNERMPYVYEGSLSPKRLLPILQVESGQNIDEHTLVILDEIQEVPRALQSLKYFCEEASHIPIVAAGSSLGLALKRRHTNTNSPGDRSVSFPVGKVSFLDLHPMGFIEFLLATGHQLLAGAIEQLDWGTLYAFNDQINELLRTYMYVGGMPEAVAAYASTQDYFQVRDIQNELLRSYDRDFDKHTNSTLAERIRLVWRSIPSNLAKENRKFIFSKLKPSARAREYEDALQWLDDSSLVHRVYRVSEPLSPLASHRDNDAFKVFCHDVGLLGAMNNLDARDVFEPEKLFSSFKGSLAEQLALQEIICAGQAGSPHYFKNDATGTEIDFIVDGNRLNPSVIPLEVKSGSNLRSKSLAAYVRKHSPSMALRTSMSSHALDGVIEDVPLYALESYFRNNLTGL